MACDEHLADYGVEVCQAHRTRKNTVEAEPLWRERALWPSPTISLFVRTKPSHSGNNERLLHQFLIGAPAGVSLDFFAAIPTAASNLQLVHQHRILLRQAATRTFLGPPGIFLGINVQRAG